MRVVLDVNLYLPILRGIPHWKKTKEALQTLIGALKYYFGTPRDTKARHGKCSKVMHMLWMCKVHFQLPFLS